MEIIKDYKAALTYKELFESLEIGDTVKYHANEDNFNSVSNSAYAMNGGEKQFRVNRSKDKFHFYVTRLK